MKRDKLWWAGLTQEERARLRYLESRLKWSDFRLDINACLRTDLRRLLRKADGKRGSHAI